MPDVPGPDVECSCPMLAVSMHVCPADVLRSWQAVVSALGLTRTTNNSTDDTERGAKAWHVNGWRCFHARVTSTRRIFEFNNTRQPRMDDEPKPCDLATLQTFEFERVLLESESTLDDAVGAASRVGSGPATHPPARSRDDVRLCAPR